MPDMDPTTEVICTSTKVHQESFDEVVRKAHPAPLVVPLFQRRYCWEKAQWAKLFADVEGAVSSGNALFLGRILAFVGPGAESPLVCDGQQRLLSITLLLAALRDVADACSAHALSAEVDDQLFVDGTARTMPRIVPTYYDRPEYGAAIGTARSGTPQAVPLPAAAPAADGRSAIAEAKAFFRHRLTLAFARVHGPGDENDADGTIPRAQWLPSLAGWTEACRDRVHFVYFQLREDEEVHRVFELHAHREKVMKTTWNFDTPGMQLAACDLIRNLIMGAIPGEQAQQEAHATHWLPMEAHATGGSGAAFDLEAFFMAFLHTVQFSVGARPELYVGFKAWMQNAVLKDVDEGDDAARGEAVTRALELMCAEAKKWEDHVHRREQAPQT